MPAVEPRLRVAVSSCLLGQPVRFDAGHKRDRFLVETLGRFVDWVPVCPELESGLGVPREPLQLRRDGSTVRLVTVRTGRDETARLSAFTADRLAALARDDVSGYVLKKNSPSCGLDVPVYGPAGAPDRSGRGVFAAALAERFPTLPMEEEGHLVDPQLRENFIERLFAYRRVTDLFATPRWTVGGLVRFHTAHKLLLMSHAPAAYQALGRLVAQAKGRPRAALAAEYAHGFMAALRVLATRGRHVNVLEHMLGYFTDTLDADSYRELRDLIQRYAAGTVPLIVPITRFAHHIQRCEVRYLAGQVYLNPHPSELMLRNDV